MKKKQLAFLAVDPIGIPLLRGIFQGLSLEFNITVYTFMRVDKAKVPSGIRLRSCPDRLHQRLKYAWLTLLFGVDHMQVTFDVLHAQSALPGGVLARRLSRMFNIPFLITLIGGEVENMSEVPFGDLRNPKLKSITKKVCVDAQSLTVMSSYQATSVRENLSINRHIVVLPYTPMVRELPSKTSLSPILNLVHVAYHHPVKNHLMLLECFQLIVSKMKATLTVIGKNYDTPFFEMAEKSGVADHIRVVGGIEHAELEKYYRAADIMLHTSWYEGLPAVAVEAMAHGVVVCGTRVGIISDFADQFTVATPIGDSLALANAVNELVRDEKRFFQFRRSAHEWIRNHDQKYYVREITRLYNDIGS